MPDAMTMLLPMAVLVTFALLWGGIGAEPISDLSESVRACNDESKRR